MEKILHKRGDSFLISAVVKIGGVAQDITNWGIQSQIRREGDTAFKVDVTVERVDDLAGSYILRVDDTSAWPIACLVWEVQYTMDTGQVISTQTVTIDVRKDVTRP